MMEELEEREEGTLELLVINFFSKRVGS